MAGEKPFPRVPEPASVNAELQNLARGDQTGLRATRSAQTSIGRAPRLIRARRIAISASQSAIDRDVSSHARRESARARDAVAERRDADADARDADASARDELTAAMDAELAQAARERSALASEAAARDRAAARTDRVRAAEDRRAAQAALVMEGTDDLTGALRRSDGLDGLRRELERTWRTSESLTVAFIDVDHLKQVNDEHGHIAGDALLRGVVASVKKVLRPYDLIMRFGGDEFVCVLCGETSAGLDRRFAQVAASLARRHAGASITVGFARAVAQESGEQLVARADETMIDARRARASVI